MLRVLRLSSTNPLVWQLSFTGKVSLAQAVKQLKAGLQADSWPAALS